MKSAPHYQRRETLAYAPRVSTIALALSLLFPFAAPAAEYLVANESDLRDAMTMANNNHDTSAIIRMTTNFTVTGSVFPAAQMPMTIDTQGFTLSTDSASANIVVNNSNQLTFNGTFAGVSGTAHQRP